MTDYLAYKLQRLTALLLAVMVIVHLAVILYAIKDGLSANEILARTRASLFWPGFYFVFVITVSIHAPIGLGNILREWAHVPARGAQVISAIFAAILFFTGLAAVWAIA